MSSIANTPASRPAEQRTSRRDLRRSLRQQRTQLSRAVQQAHARTVIRHLIASGTLLAGRTFAVYSAADGELDTAPIIDHLLATGRVVALPVVNRAGAMDFYRVTTTTPLLMNRFGIPEPDPLTATYVPRLALDIVFAPLVAFDKLGHRLGMGGGYYDRFLMSRGHRPLLVGLAHALQEVGSLPRETWDVPMDAAVTESGLTGFSTRARRFCRPRGC
jgi:5-formyltetrahydrofolate cyclo-ligase